MRLTTFCIATTGCVRQSHFGASITRERGGHTQHGIQVGGLEPPDATLCAREYVGANLSVPSQRGTESCESATGATLNAAKFLRIEDSLGTVEMGKLADLVLLDEKPLENIRYTQKIRPVIL
jgi:Amidohydrolase family